MARLEAEIRQDLNRSAERRMAVLDPLKVVLTNYPEDRTEMMTAVNHPNREELGTRQVPFGREIYIERSDFMEDAPRKFFRLKPGGEVRLRFAYIVRCDEVIRDDDGEIVALHCSYDEETRSGSPAAQRKVKGTIHWVSAAHAVPAEVRLYDRLFTVPDPGGAEDFLDHLNPDSLAIAEAMLEPSLAAAGSAFQFERTGYFCPDAVDHAAGRPVFNRVVTLRDSWARVEQQALQEKQ